MARSFNGSSGSVSYATTAAQQGLTAITVHARIYRSSGGEAGYGIVFRMSDNSTNIRFQFDNDNGDAGWGLRWLADFSGGIGGWSVPYPTNSTWTDYVITYDGSSTSNDPVIYKDGSSIAVTDRLSPSGSLKNNQGFITIGNSVPDTDTWNGRIAEVAVWNRVLSADEAAALGKGFSPKFIPRGLVFYSPLRGTGPEPDLVGGTTPTITATSAADHPRVINPTPVGTELVAAASAAGSRKNLSLLGVG